MACHRIRLRRSSGQRSAASRGKRAEAYAFFRSNGSEIFFASGFISSSAILFGTEVNAARFGSGLKQSNMGVAVASNTFIGGKPRIHSMVRTRLVWLYCALTTVPRRVYGLTTYAVVR